MGTSIFIWYCVCVLKCFIFFIFLVHQARVGKQANEHSHEWCEKFFFYELMRIIEMVRRVRDRQGLRNYKRFYFRVRWGVGFGFLSSVEVRTKDVPPIVTTIQKMQIIHNTTHFFSFNNNAKKRRSKRKRNIESLKRYFAMENLQNAMENNKWDIVQISYVGQK